MSPSFTPSFAAAPSNQSVEPFALPPQVIFGAPTGTTPSAATTSASAQPIVATRVGALSIVVAPCAWVIVTGYAAASAEAAAVADVAGPAPDGPVAQPARSRASAGAATSRWRRDGMLNLRGCELGNPWLGKAYLIHT